MIIIKVNGGLGNQLQQYALYEKFKSMGKEVRLDASWYKQEHDMAKERAFELPRFSDAEYQLCTEDEYKKVLGNQRLINKVIGKVFLKMNSYYTERIMYDSSIFSFENKILEGYWACEAYYADIIPVLQNKLKFPISTNCANIDISEKMRFEESVSIHLRRGDYLNPENKYVFGNICTEEYYSGAIAYIREHINNPRFYVFSDDIEYASEHYQGNEFQIVDWNNGDNSIFDMYLMSQCKHNICANSTFSFWGARLNSNIDKIMIRPLKQKNTMNYEPEKMLQLWNGWVLFDSGKKV